MTSFYLILMEIPSILVRKLDYLKSVTKVANIVTPFLILYNVFSTKTKEVTFWEV